MDNCRLKFKGNWAAHLFGPLMCLPSVPLELFTLSIIISVELTVIITVMGVAFNQSLIGIRTPFLNSLTYQWFFDPITWHFVVGILASFLIFTQAQYIRGADLWSRIIASGIPFVLIVLVFLVGDLLIKPAYAVDRLLNPLPEPILVSFFDRLIESGPPKADSMPSGFVMRQVSLFYLVTWIVIQMKYTKKWIRIGCEAISILGLLIVVFSRIYRGAHSLLDVSAAIGVGTLIFWIIMLPPFNIITLRRFYIHKIRLCELVAGILILFLIFLGFSNNASALIKLFIYSMIVIGVVFSVSPILCLSDIRVVPRYVHNNPLLYPNTKINTTSN
jgi:membrane-associated phospholipid phosphatase